ncbi:9632_t:CDS:2, partial [Entrophospora sp. SA101]
DTSKTITKMFENHQPHTSQKQEQLEKALFLPNIARYGCSAHTIQLVIDYPKQQQLLSAIGDVPTCWNSSYLAWERIYNLKDAIYTALNTILRNKKDSQSKKDYNRLKKIMLQEEEWDFMLEMIGVLGPFYEFTQILGASDYVTINLVYPLINTLKEECKNTTNNVYDYEENENKSTTRYVWFNWCNKIIVI